MPEQPRIKVTENGPYLVTGSVPIRVQTIATDATGEPNEWIEGASVEAPERYLLCRCGNSGNKPFCDGTHNRVNFDGTETASRAPYAQQAQVIDGPEMALSDVQALCAAARFCHLNGTVWRQVRRTDDPAVREQFVRQVGDCPSGRLVAWDKETGLPIEPALPQSIGLVQDPTKNVSGPLWVRGGIAVESADGEVYEVRNRQTLCRCGASGNKPFCDGSHITVGFRDNR
ncbi:MAG: CDGSH iron-sulfur domain-containing protein [Caldilineaceae bacterium]|nr:CDGSH iron-sulfur domain-containing protein [Caldilineaceae bacterium]